MHYKYRLKNLLADYDFTSSVHSLVKSFEELTRNFEVSQEECSSGSAPYSHDLAMLMLHLIIRVNNYNQKIVFLAGNRGICSNK